MPILTNDKTHQQILNELYKKGSFDEMISFCTDEIEKDKSSCLLYGARGKALYKLKKFGSLTVFVEL